MARAKKPVANSGPIDPDALAPYGDTYRKLKHDIDVAREAMAEFMHGMKTDGYNIKHVKKAMAVEEIGIDEYEADDQEFQLYLRGFGITHKYQTTY